MCGNIGVGKSTLCGYLAEKYTEGVFMKEELENPFLGKYYDFMASNPNKENPFAFDM